jgi:hypothetical protein
MRHLDEEATMKVSKAVEAKQESDESFTPRRGQPCEQQKPGPRQYYSRE